jgi:hypothetical protein
LKDAVLAHGGKDWGEIAALVPGRTKIQCNQRWKNGLDPSIASTAGRTGKWTPDEDCKLMDAVQTHGANNWGAITALVPGRTRKQCNERWKNSLVPSFDRANGRTGKWAEDEDSKLKDAVQMCGGKDWAAITALVPGRAIKQCKARWKGVLDPSIDRASGRSCWTEDEDGMLKDAVQTHGGKNS